MQQDNNHIENKLRQLENQQLPDLSQMDAHWQQMEAALLPGISIPRKRSLYVKRIKKIVIAATIAAALVIGFFRYGTTGDIKTKTVTNDKATVPAVNNTRPVILLTDSSIGSLATGVNKNNVYHGTVGRQRADILKVIDTTAQISEDTNALNHTLNTGNTINETTMSLSSFYNKIQKAAQEFIVNSVKGGKIICAEGTKIFFPPSAFADADGKAIDGDITIKVEEYYRYADIVAANLTTTSNGEQLVTGGMVKLTAFKDNKEVVLRNNKLVNLSMPTKNFDPAMELFLTNDNNKNEKYTSSTAGNMDTSVTYNQASGAYGRRINWQVANAMRPAMFDGKTNFLNMEDAPVRVRETKHRRIAKFHITNELPMTEDEAKKILKEKYGDYYDVIKVKKIKPVRKILFSKWATIRQHIGDSTKLTVEQAIRWHYIDRKDSAFYAQKTSADSINFYKNRELAILGWLNGSGIYGFLSDSAYSHRHDRKLVDSLNKVVEERQQIEQTYNFTIAKMGWINCDRFYSYPEKTDFVLNLPPGVRADKFVTQIVFTSIRSVMPGQFYQNKIGFLNVPANMPVYIVGLGERNGKVVSFMQPLKTSASEISINKLDETTPEAFKEKLRQLDL